MLSFRDKQVDNLGEQLKGFGARNLDMWVIWNSLVSHGPPRSWWQVCNFLSTQPQNRTEKGGELRRCVTKHSTWCDSDCR